MNTDFVALDCSQIEKRIEALELKRYWVAESAGIHKSTLRRWLTGEIAHVRESRVQRLAEVLEISMENIASRRERFNASKRIANEK